MMILFCEECARKERVIKKYKAGHVRRKAMANQIHALVADRAMWRRCAQDGSRTANRTINALKDKVHALEMELAALRAAFPSEGTDQ